MARFYDTEDAFLEANGEALARVRAAATPDQREALDRHLAEQRRRDLQVALGEAFIALARAFGAGRREQPRA